MNIAETVNSYISGIEFGFLSDKEIYALSVAKIVNPTTFDNLLQPNKGGLYDIALGSFQNGYCGTCRLRTLDGCPGHCGHIELPIRVYHPTYIDQLLRLLRAKCVFCHRFRLKRLEHNSFVSKLRLLNVGLVKEAQDIDREVGLIMKRSSSKADSSEDEDEAENSNRIEAQNIYVERALRLNRKAGTTKQAGYTETAAEARKALLREFMGRVVLDRPCGNCNGRSPPWRKEKYVKIFMKGMNRKGLEHNSKMEKRMENPMTILSRRDARAGALTNGVSGHDHDNPALTLTYAVGGDGSDTSSDHTRSGDSDMALDDEEDDMLQTAKAMAALNLSRDKKVNLPDTFLGAEEVYAAMVLLFERESTLLRLVYSPKSKSKDHVPMSADMFFVKTLLVSPSKYRPENPGDGRSVTEHQRNSLYKAVLDQNLTIHQIHSEMVGKRIPDNGRQPRGERELKLAQITLQEHVNALIDTSTNTTRANANLEGIKQTLEKKEGLFRQNMMGKRVNFAGRSVISPDPNIETNEIGVPPIFATKLTYPEPLTQHNYFELRQAVINGPTTWPGAMAVEAEDGKILSLVGRTIEERKSIANQLLSPQGVVMDGPQSKKIHRHLVNGDIVIMNRQPTLHKPSMMCHRVRVLIGEKTIRMHYANCKTYNADFDGDEMNMHFPQNELARAEANLIADTDHQYLSSTAGKPLRGLIQDHISVSVRLSSRDSFFSREDYYQLVYAALRPENGHTVSGSLEFVAPAILKPRPLWTGKQIFTTLLKNLTPITYPGLTMESSSATAGTRWGGPFEDEERVMFVQGEFIRGILDNKQIGPNGGGLIHGVYETLGPTIAGKLLGTIGRLLTKLLHMQAVSCGVEDLILTPSGEAARREQLKKAKTIGLEVAARYVTLEKQNPTEDNPEFLRRMEDVLRDDEKQKGLDELSKANGNALSSDVTKSCLPGQLIKQFPKNQMQLMTGTGAKGSVVNANLISCNLGQQTLEGRRVPTMVSGKTLPCFRPFDPSLRAGGYIQDRFLTGVNPQEYYFHAMAGREGLIDTAVKTSRSGYLQRCLVKGMEGLQVQYDCSVRDTGDGSVIQFLYGEDGLDTTKSVLMNNFKFTAQNFLSLYSSLNVHEEYKKVHNQDAYKHNKSVVKKPKNRDPATSIWNPAVHAGSMSEKYYRAVQNYMIANPDKLVSDQEKGISGVADKAFRMLSEMRYMKSLAEAGEAVGIVAAQSVGEPSTQMTLNTFHLAGHASKNVTLGIPRLREIVMTASAKISTPMMTLHLHDFVTNDEGEKFAKELSRLSLADVVDQTSVTEEIRSGNAFPYSKFYRIRFDFFPPAEYEKEYNIRVQQVLEAIATKFLPMLCTKILREFKRKPTKTSAVVASDALPTLGQSAGRSEEHAGRARRQRGEDDSDSDSSEDEAEEDMDADTAKRKSKQSELKDYAEAEDEEDLEIASQASDDVPDDDEDPDTTTTNAKENKDHEGDGLDDSDMPDQDHGQIYINHSAEEILEFVRNQKSNRAISDFTIDKHGRYCEAVLEYSAESQKLLMLQLVESCTRSTVIRAISGIKSCLYDTTNKYEDPVTEQEVNEPAIVTEGCNLMAVRDFQEYVNCNRVFTNDIAAVLNIYGVEACRATIAREMHAVFQGHSITVNQRHLNLIADTMTRNGRYLPFSRNGMKNAVSAFMKMSFETTVGFLKEAMLSQEAETLTNPSARIVVGGLSKVGTGSFDLYVPTDGSAMVRDDDSD